MSKLAIAYIDLATREVNVVPVSEDLRRRFLGGRGIAMWILYKTLKAGIPPLDPRNLLIVSTGLLTGTFAIASSRTNISGKSPETGYLGDSSFGGHFGAELRHAGFDHLVISNRSDKPIYLRISDGNIYFHDAQHLENCDTFELQDVIRQELKDDLVQVACIGPAGRKQVRFASVIHGYGGNAAGRTGMGALMGSKNLWAIAVRGRQPLLTHSPEKLMEVVKKHYQIIKSSKGYEATATYGTLIRLNNSRMVGFEGGLNHQFNMMEKGGEELDADYFLKKFEVSKKACFNCPIHCKHVWQIKQRGSKGLHGIGMEYYGAGGFGSQCGSGSWETILEAFDLCNRYGLDASSTSAYVAWVMELYQRGIITREDTGGLPLEWGSREAIIGLIHQIIEGRNLGGILAEGWQEAARKIGKNAGRYMNQIKNLSIEPDDVRAFKAKSLGLATSTRGSDHLRSRYTMEEFHLPSEVSEKITGRPVPQDPGAYEGKAWAVFWSECLCAVTDALGICKFATKWLSPSLLSFAELAELIAVSTGLELTEQQVMKIGERIYNVERLFITREGIRRKDDSVHWRMREPYTHGYLKGTCIDEEKFQKLLTEYYRVHQWDEEGIPPAKTLEGLEIE